MSVAGGPVMEVALRVNGTAVTARVAPRQTLADLVRDECRLTGTHLGCEQGICGACTVLLDGEPVRACLVFAWQAEGHEVVTVEGAHLVPSVACAQRHVEQRQAFQCGFCTPGFVMLLGGVLGRQGATAEAVEAALTGNVCRCTGYRDLRDAALAAHAELQS